MVCKSGRRSGKGNSRVKYKVAEPNELVEGGKRIVKVKEMELGLFLVKGQY
jgi:hypothetical protein